MAKNEKVTIAPADVAVLPAPTKEPEIEPTKEPEIEPRLRKAIAAGTARRIELENADAVSQWYVGPLLSAVREAVTRGDREVVVVGWGSKRVPANAIVAPLSLDKLQDGLAKIAGLHITSIEGEMRITWGES